MILVVLGHAIQITIRDDCYTNHLWNIIYSFHMPAFVAVSGYFAFRPFAKSSGEGRLELGTTMTRRIRQLIIPFLIWTTISLLINNKLTFSTFVSYLVIPDDGLWFLWVLFFINVLFLIVTYIFKKINYPEEIGILGMCLILTLIMVLFEIRVFGFQFIAFYFLFYCMGYAIHKYYEMVKTNNIFVLLIIAIVWGFLAWNWKMSEPPTFLDGIPVPSALMLYGYRFITACAAIYLLLMVAPRVLNNQHHLNTLISTFGGVSLGIYAVHYLVIANAFGFCNRQGYEIPLIVLITFISGVLITWGIVFVLNMVPQARKILLGKI